MRLGDLDALKAEVGSWGMNDYEPADFIDAIDAAPTVEPTFGLFKEMLCSECGKRPQGEWIEGKNGNIKCNKCGCEIRYSYLIGNEPDFPKFCCDCGAKMKGGAE